MAARSALWLVLATVVLEVWAQSCGLDNKCPSATPCCSQYGQCGVGAYCLGGCDPRSSSSLDSCVPAPVCQDKSYTFPNLNGIKANTEYLGDATTADWVSSGEPVSYNNNVLLTMAQGTVGTLLASTDYVWYGNVQATFRTSRSQGVVTAFILLSDVKDEIDYEFVGVELETAQTNYYWQGIPDYTHSANISLTDTFANYHTYEIDWTPDQVTWSIDGQVGRTLNRSSTWNSTTNQWMFPQTPARIQLSLWPGGLASNGQGTIDWAGGLVDWNSADVKTNGYFYAAFESVTVKCFNAPSPPGTNSGTSYTYSSYTGTNESVVDGDKPTVLKSFMGTGTDMDAGAPSGSAPSATAAAQVPGLTGGNPGVNVHNQGGSSAGSSTQTASTAAQTGFSQGPAQNAKSGADKMVAQEKVLKGSLLTALIVLGTLMAL